MMVGVSLFVAAELAMAVAFLGLLRAGVAAGELDARHKLGIGAYGVCVLLMLTQAALWSLWGLWLGWGVQ